MTALQAVRPTLDFWQDRVYISAAVPIQFPIQWRPAHTTSLLCAQSCKKQFCDVITNRLACWWRLCVVGGVVIGVIDSLGRQKAARA
jgi:hypothetical protein